MKKIFIILMFLIVGLTIKATTYYIATPANGGKNTNTGLAGSPWATLSYACAHALNSGDIIHVMAGSFIEPNQCFLASNVSIEGEGSVSIIHSTFVSSTYENDMTDGWIMLQNGINIGQHISGVYFEGSNLTCDKAICVNNRNNVAIYNCTIINFLLQGIRFDNGVGNSGNTVNNCVLTNSGGIGLGDRHACLAVLHNTGFLCHDNIINTNLRPDGQNGLGFKAFWDVSNLKIYNNIFNCPPICDGNNDYPFALEFWDNTLTGYGTEIYGNTIVGQLDLGSGTTKGTYLYSYWIHNNIFGNNTVYTANQWVCGLQCELNLNDIIINSNHFLNQETAIYLCSWQSNISFNNIQIFNNIFENIVYGNSTLQVPPPVNNSSHGTGIQIGGSVTPHSTSNIYIWNNTFISYAGRPAEAAIWIPTADITSNIYIQNNIILGFVTAPYIADYMSSGGKLSNLVLQKNVLYNNGNSNNLLHVNFTPSPLTDDGGIKSNPIFTSSTDFHLHIGSPAIGAGIFIQ